MRFVDVGGLAEVRKKLVASVKNDHVAHAQLFLGRAGSPNLPMALAFAAYLNCEDPSGDDSCGVCSSCVKNAKFIHPDVHFVFPVSPTKTVSGKDVISTSFLKEWREFLTTSPFATLDQWAACYGGENKEANISKEESRQIIKNLSLKAFEGKYKVMIIWLPEYMHPSAANGILKILEEPPEKTVFLLASNNAEKLLTTILSRTQIVTMPNLSDEELVTVLIEKHQISEDQARQFAHLADGDLNAALRLIHNVEDDGHQLFADWMRDCFKRDFTALVRRSDEFHGMNKVAQKSLLLYGMNMMRESLMSHAAPELLRVNGRESQFIENFSKVIDEDKATKITTLLNEAHFHLERNAGARMVFLDLSLQIAAIIK